MEWQLSIVLLQCLALVRISSAIPDDVLAGLERFSALADDVSPGEGLQNRFGEVVL